MVSLKIKNFEGWMFKLLGKNNGIFCAVKTFLDGNCRVSIVRFVKKIGKFIEVRILKLKICGILFLALSRLS